MTTDHQAVYDDAELHAIQIVREAAAEWDDAGKAYSKDMQEHLVTVYSRHGSSGVHALVVALGRFANVLLQLRADATGQDASQILDDLELGKIEQHQYEKDNPWDRDL